ncbi:MAG: TetR/AcrR family transcriptional regulator [Candidatus Methylacidiphilales bacterium]
MKGKAKKVAEPQPQDIPRPSNRLVRIDAQRNLDSLLRAALIVFEESGVDAPVREIAEKAGVGIGTMYRHFPERSDLIKAVVRQEIDDCMQAGQMLADKHRDAPGEALALWMQRLVDLVKTKRGLGPALHSGNPAYQSLPDYFLSSLAPVMQNLLDAAKSAGVIRPDVEAKELLLAGTRLAAPASEGDVAQARRMVALLVDGLRFGTVAGNTAPASVSTSAASV